MRIIEGILSVISGSSRNGKTVYVKRMVERFKRVMVWDVDGEYTSGFVSVDSIGQLISLIKKQGMQSLNVSYRPKSLDEFDAFCAVAVAWGTDTGELACVVEETADISSAGKAQGNFRILIGRGMKRGISLFCVTQRPSESEKTSLGNAKKIVTFYMTRAKDRDYMATELVCESEDIEGLEPLHYLEKDVDKRKIVQGSITF